MISDNLPKEISSDFLPLLKAIGSGRIAVSIGGSHGRGTADMHSDYDFRVFTDNLVDASSQEGRKTWHQIDKLRKKWESAGIKIDQPWPRCISAIEEELDLWVKGKARSIEMSWTVWGYYLPADILNQHVLYDPSHVIESWALTLKPYPGKLKKSIISFYSEILRYWINDYHWQSKIERKDFVFLNGLTAKLIHSIMQVLFAVNETYFPGDGNNLSYIKDFSKKPKDFEIKINKIFFQKGRGETIRDQQFLLRDIADEILTISEKNKGVNRA